MAFKPIIILKVTPGSPAAVYSITRFLNKMHPAEHKEWGGRGEYLRRRDRLHTTYPAQAMLYYVGAGSGHLPVLDDSAMAGHGQD